MVYFVLNYLCRKICESACNRFEFIVGIFYGYSFITLCFALPVKRQTTLFGFVFTVSPVSYTHLRAHETGRNLVCRLLLEKKKKKRLKKKKEKERINNETHNPNN